MTANRIYIYVTACMVTVAASAQEDNISPYSMYGIGELQLGESGRTAGMASTAIGLSGLHFLNPANPAALAALDTATFIFDLTGSAKGSVFTSGAVTQKAFSANFTRIAVGTHLTPRWSAALSMQPYSTVNYKVENEAYVEGSETKTTTLLEGSGGVTRLSFLNSIRLTNRFSAGVDFMLLFGSIDRDASQSGITINRSSSANTASFTLGMLYKQPLSGNMVFSAGVTYGYKTSLLFDNSMVVTDASGNSLFNNKIASSEIFIPESWGAGISLTGRKMVIAADYRFQKWSETRDPLTRLRFTDTHKFNCGIAFIPSGGVPKTYLGLIEYQAGFIISNSYLTLNGVNPLNMELTAGAGLPLRGGGQLNIGLGLGKRGATNESLIREDYMRITISISMSERMFLKRVYE